MATLTFIQLQDRDWLYDQYVIQSKSAETIAKIVGCTKYPVYRRLKEFGIPLRKRTSKYPLLNDKQWLIDKYVEQQLSIKEIAKISGSTPGNVSSALVVLGIKTRNSQEAFKVKYPDGRRGESHPGWKGGITPLNHLIRTSKEYKAWRKAVFEHDNYTCQHCGQRGGDLEADHIKQFAYYVDLRFELENGRTLCKECHKKTDTHSRKVEK